MPPKRCSNEGKTRILVAGGDLQFRHLLSERLRRENDLSVCGLADTTETIIDAVREEKPDVVVLETDIKDSGALQLIERIKALDTRVIILAVSNDNESFYVKRVIRSGAGGYITKDTLARDAAHAVRSVMNGILFVSQGIFEEIIEHYVGGHVDNSGSPVKGFTDREMEIYSLFGMGYDAHAISKTLNLSINTIFTYRYRISRKLDLAGSHELADHAARWFHHHRESGTFDS
jgi:DNA-binding NarL/FixJ family response regulator